MTTMTEDFTMPHTDSWEYAAGNALAQLCESRDFAAMILGGKPTETEALALLNQTLVGIKSAANSVMDWTEGDVKEGLLVCGMVASHFVGRTGIEVVQLLAEKQAAYGTDNINAFGLTGLHVRVSDKIARLNNMLAKDRDNDWEPLTDCWLDILGYAVITLMLHAETFERPLERDMVQ